MIGNELFSFVDDLLRHPRTHVLNRRLNRPKYTQNKKKKNTPQKNPPKNPEKGVHLRLIEFTHAA